MEKRTLSKGKQTKEVKSSMRLASIQSNRVVLNVYDLHENNDLLLPLGLGLFHSGVQINSAEYTFASGGGVFSTEPKYAPGAKFRESIDMGEFKGTSRDMDKILDELRVEFRGTDYNIILRNCNHFAEAFIKKLLNKEIPGYINRLAFIGSFFSCLIPPQLTNEAPVNDGNNSNTRSITESTKPLNAFSGTGMKLGSDTANSGTNAAETISINERREILAKAAAMRMTQK